MKRFCFVVLALGFFCEFDLIAQVRIPGPGGFRPSGGGGGGVNGFTNARPLTVDHLQVGLDQTNFPVLVNQTIANLKSTGNGGSVTDAQCDDCVFTSDIGCSTTLPWQVESYDALTGAIVAWVKIASLSSTVDTPFYICYGKASITTFQGGSPSAIWDSKFYSRYHLAENAANTTVTDSPSNAVTGTATANTSTLTTTGQIANGFDIETSNSFSTTPPAGSNSRTWSFCTWFNAAIGTDNHFLVYNANQDAGVYINPAGTIVLYNGGTLHTSTAAVSSDTWTHICVRALFNTSMEIFINGSLDSTTGSVMPLLDGTALQYGSFPTPYPAGKLDEISLVNDQLSAAWIAAEWNNQKTGSTFVTVGSEI